MTTLDDLVTKVHAMLTGVTGRERINRLDADIDDTVSVVPLTFEAEAGFRQGAILSIDYEMLTVFLANGQAMTCARGQMGSAADAHTEGAIVNVEPLWPRWLILEAIREELRAFPESLFQVEHVSLATGVAANTIDLDGATGEVLQVIRARTVDPTSSVRPWADVEVRLLRGMDTDVYPSGFGVQLMDGLMAGPGVTLELTLATKFDLTTVAPTTILETTIGLPASMHDILTYGAGARLLLGKEATRDDLQRQAQSGDGADVPPGTWVQAAAAWRQIRDRRRSEEEVRLIERWGM